MNVMVYAFEPVKNLKQPVSDRRQILIWKTIFLSGELSEPVFDIYDRFKSIHMEKWKMEALLDWIKGSIILVWNSLEGKKNIWDKFRRNYDSFNCTSHLAIYS